MPEFLQDPNWLDVIIGFIALIAGTFISIYLYRKQRNVKKLSYWVDASQRLFSVEEELENEITIHFKNGEVKGLELLQVGIVNNGTVPIEKSDFEQPLKIKLNEKVEILSYEIINEDPSGLLANLTLDSTTSTVVLDSLLLNPTDSLVIKLLLTNFDWKFDIDTRIKGVKQLLSLDYPQDFWGSFVKEVFAASSYSPLELRIISGIALTGPSVGIALLLTLILPQFIFLLPISDFLQFGVYSIAVFTPSVLFPVIIYALVLPYIQEKVFKNRWFLNIS